MELGRAAADRLRRPAAALFLYTLLALAIISPLASPILPDTAAQDLANHVAGIVEATNAFAEGQFPIRVAPHQCNGERYPTFQFYGNFPYTAGAALCRYAHFSPYQAYKALLVLSLVAGAFFTYRCGVLLTSAVTPSVVAGAVFITAPYMLTDIHARAAFTEAIAFNLLPVVLFYAMRCFASRALAVPLSAISWSCLALSHNVAYFFASLFFCTYFLLHALWQGERFRGLLLVGAGYGVGLLLAAWYIAPQLAILRELHIGQQEWKNFIREFTWLTPLGVLLAPTLVLPRPFPALDNPRFGLQIGWPILAALWLAVRALCSAGTARPARTSIVRILALFTAAFLLVWAPADLWRYLPRIFTYAQFSYRLLMFCVLWGALLAAHAVAFWFKRGLRTEHVLVIILALGTCASPYLSPMYTTSGTVSEAAEIMHPDHGRGGSNDNYQMAPSALARGPLTLTDSATRVLTAAEVRAATRCRSPIRFLFNTSGPCLVQLPVLFYPRLLEVRHNGRVVSYGHLDKYLALLVPPGDHDIRVRFAGLHWANRLSAAAWAGVLLALPVLACASGWRRFRRRVVATATYPFLKL
jgi:hypothetical protein